MTWHDVYESADFMLKFTVTLVLTVAILGTPFVIGIWIIGHMMQRASRE